jgi:hypothetical protein
MAIVKFVHKVLLNIKGGLRLRRVRRSRSLHEFKCVGFSLYVDAYMYQCDVCSKLIYRRKLSNVKRLNRRYGDCD